MEKNKPSNLNLLVTIGLISSTLFFVNCGSDDEPDPDGGNGVTPVEVTVQIDDPNAVAAAIEVAGATVAQGDPPAPTTDAGTPEITSGNVNVKSSQDGSASISLDVNVEDLVGLYFQVEGASSYLDIPISANGRILMEEEVTVEIDLTEGFEPGIFCGIVCAYDEQNRVSQPVTVCIEVLELGGENSAFLIGTWELTASQDPNGDVIPVGTNEEFTETFHCQNGSTVDVTSIDRTDFIDVVFTSAGAISVDGQEYYKELDHGASTCDNIVFLEETDNIDLDGIWTYDDVAKQLDMVLQNNDSGEQEVVSFIVVRNGSNVELTFTGQTDEGTLFFKPK